MDNKVIETVWELYKKGWSFERIALELELRRDEVEEAFRKKKKEEDFLESKEQTREEDCDQEQDKKYEADKEEEGFAIPSKKVKKI